MSGGGISSQFSSWRLKGYPQVVEYSVPLVDGIVAEVVSSFRKFPHGGLAVGGVLFGEGDKHLVRILKVRPIPCDHSSGPSFTLSEADHAALAELLDNFQEDPELRDLIPVGWYHSHTRSGLNFTPSDLEVHQRHFREPWQIALVLRPDIDKPTAAGIFTRREDGGIPSQPLLQLDSIRSNGAVSPPPPAGVESAEPEGAGAPAAADPPESGGLAKQKESPGRFMKVPTFGHYGYVREEPSASGRRKVLKKVAAGVAGVIALFAAYQYLIPQEYWRAFGYYGGQVGPYLSSCVEYWTETVLAPEEPSLSLRPLAAGGGLLIRWDSTSRVLIGATAGRIEIDDGGRQMVRNLMLTDLAQGSFQYHQRSNDVRVRLTVVRDDGAPASRAVVPAAG